MPFPHSSKHSIHAFFRRVYVREKERAKMMNILAIALVLTSLAAAGVWSPPPAKQTATYVGDSGEQVIVKEGHQVVVVEYENQGDTKVLISPHDGEVSVSGSGEEEARNRARENGHALSPRELICDALGSCKHKIARVIGRGKDRAAEKAHEVFDKMREVEEDAKDDSAEAFVHAKDAASRGATTVKETAAEAYGNAKEAASEKAETVVKGAKEAASEKAETVVKGAKEAVGRAKEAGKDVGRNVLEKEERVRGRAGKKVEEARDAAEEVVERARARAHELRKEGKENVTKLLRRASNAVVIASSRRVVGAVIGVVQLLGFCSGYGMGLWVTFVPSYVLSGALTRAQFAVVQSRIYPVYFKAMGISIGVTLVAHLIGQRWRELVSRAEVFQSYNLGVSLLMILINLLYLEPRATKVMFEGMKLEKEEGRGISVSSAETIRAVEPQVAGSADATVRETPEHELIRSQILKLNERLKSLNTQSSFLNILTLMSLSWHLVYLGQRLHVVC